MNSSIEVLLSGKQNFQRVPRNLRFSKYKAPDKGY